MPSPRRHHLSPRVAKTDPSDDPELDTSEDFNTPAEVVAIEDVTAAPDDQDSVFDEEDEEEEEEEQKKVTKKTKSKSSRGRLLSRIKRKDKDKDKDEPLS